MSVLVIAEIGSNHGGSLDRALALIDAAADAGADAAKFQYFRVDRFIVPRENPESLRRYELPDEWLPLLASKCQSRGIEFMCTAFDLASLDVIDPFVKRHKVGSYEATDDAYLAAVKKKGKYVIVSEGRKVGICADVVLRCVSEYPAKIDGYLYVDSLPTEAWAGWGVSDHTLHPTIVPAAAVALGACVVEKHFQLLEGPPSPDYPVSIYPEQFRAMVEAVRLTEKAVGR